MGKFRKDVLKVKSRKSRFFVVAAILLVVVLLAGAGYLIFKTTSGSDVDDRGLGKAETVNVLYENIDRDDVDIDEYINGQIGSPDVPNRVKSEAYLIKISQEYNANDGAPDMDKILEYALLAYELYPSGNTADTLAFIYEQTDDINNAIKYHELAIEKETEEEKETDQGSSREYHEQSIQRLRSGEGQ